MRKLAFIIPLIVLSGCGGYDGPETDQGAQQGAQGEQTMQGIQVTATVPYAHESLQDIIDREKNDPLPARGNKVMPDHRLK